MPRLVQGLGGKINCAALDNVNCQFELNKENIGFGWIRLTEIFNII